MSDLLKKMMQKKNGINFIPSEEQEEDTIDMQEVDEEDEDDEDGDTV